MIDYKIRLNLQLFADGGTAGAAGAAGGADGGGEMGMEGAQGVGQTPTGDGDSRDFEAEFQDLIKGEYKDVYSKHVQSAVNSRMGKSRKQANAMQGVLDAFGAALGVDSHDLGALMQAAQDYGVEDEALEQGCTVEEVKLRRENKRLRAQQEAAANAENSERIRQEEAAVQEKYPGFDFRAESAADPRFVQLCGLVGMEKAYKMLHDDEITAATVNYTAETVRNNVSRSIASGNQRPRENGVSARGAISAKARIDAMTDDDVGALIDQAIREGRPIEI